MALFTGCGTALITPFRKGEIDYAALDRLVETQLEAGVDALIAAGTTGEPATMTWEEHLNVIRRVVDVTHGRVPVIAGTGSNCTREAVEAARMSKQFGADAQLVVTPYYNKTSQEGLIAHYHAVADAATLPVIVYNVPSRTGINMGPEALAAICAHPNIIGVKEASSDVGQSLEKMRMVGSGGFLLRKRRYRRADDRLRIQRSYFRCVQRGTEGNHRDDPSGAGREKP